MRSTRNLKVTGSGNSSALHVLVQSRSRSRAEVFSSNPPCRWFVTSPAIFASASFLPPPWNRAFDEGASSPRPVDQRAGPSLTLAPCDRRWLPSAELTSGPCLAYPRSFCIWPDQFGLRGT
jgi:hypothetical protein